MIYKSELERIYSRLKERKQDLMAELGRMPEGSLAVSNKNGKNYYYVRFPKGGNRKKEHRAGITNDRELVFMLVRKRYLLKALDIIDEDLRNLERLLKAYRPFDEASLMEAFVRKYPELSEGAYYGTADPSGWAASHSPVQGLYEEDLRSVSSEGVSMRSKGELYIASRLQHYNIPFRYECRTDIPDLRYVPDFTVMRPADNKIFYWEHLGKVNDEKYIMDNSYKLQMYWRYGIVPWDNLIVTYDMRDGGLNAKLIDAMIYAWLI